MRAVALALAVVAAAGCRPRHPSAADNGIVVLTSNVRDAQVYLDGRFIAPLDAMRAGMAMAPGPHRIELRHDDYFSGYAEVTVGKRERKELAVPLAAILP